MGLGEGQKGFLELEFLKLNEEACDYVDNVLDVLDKFRRNADTEFKNMFEAVSSLVLQNGGVMDFPETEI